MHANTFADLVRRGDFHEAPDVSQAGPDAAPAASRRDDEAHVTPLAPN